MHGKHNQYLVKRMDTEVVTHNQVTGERLKIPVKQRVSTLPFGGPVCAAHIKPYMPPKLRKQLDGLYPNKSMNCKLELCGNHPTVVEITRLGGSV